MFEELLELIEIKFCGLEFLMVVDSQANHEESIKECGVGNIFLRLNILIDGWFILP